MSPILKELGIKHEEICYHAPSARQLRRAGNNQLSEISTKANEYSTKIVKSRDAVVTQVEWELQQPNQSTQTLAEIHGYIADANKAAENSVQVLAESARLIAETAKVSAENASSFT